MSYYIGCDCQAERCTGDCAAAENRKIVVADHADLERLRRQARRIVDREETGAADPGGPALEIISLGELIRSVRDMPPPQWLARPVWPADAYGVLAAEWKAGKTWAELDLAVSVASGTPWMGAYAVERQGPVLLFLGEGGRRKMLRRIDAIARAKNVDLALPLRVCFRVPHLTDAGHLAIIERELALTRPVLTIVDPLYLAARGASGSKLYEMGAALEGIQVACQTADSALMVVTHYNRSEGTGSKRMTGAGPAEWGRVLVNITVPTKRVDRETKEETAYLDVAFEGDEIPGTSDRFRRQIRAENPDDLESPVRYSMELVTVTPDDVDEHPGLSTKATRTLAVLDGAKNLVDGTQAYLSVREIGDGLAADGKGYPLKPETIREALRELKAAGITESYGADGTAHSWRKVASTAPPGDLPVTYL